MRERRYRRQVELGVIPAGTELAPRRLSDADPRSSSSSSPGWLWWWREAPAELLGGLSLLQTPAEARRPRGSRSLSLSASAPQRENLSHGRACESPFVAEAARPPSRIGCRGRDRDRNRVPLRFRPSRSAELLRGVPWSFILLRGTARGSVRLRKPADSHPPPRRRGRIRSRSRPRHPTPKGSGARGDARATARGPPGRNGGARLPPSCFPAAPPPDAFPPFPPRAGPDSIAPA